MTASKTRKTGKTAHDAGVFHAPRVRWFLALHIPDFPLVAAARHLDAVARARPCAVLETSATGRRTREKLPLLAVNRAAREAGIAAGGPLGRALVRCPDLTVLEHDRAGESELGQWLVTQAERAAAELEWTRPDTVIVDLTARPDAEHYAFTPDGPDGPEIRWSKAPTPDLADLAVRVEALHQHTVGTAEIAKLPIQALVLLGAQAQDLELLELWGLRTLGDLQRLPKPSLVSRLGPQAKPWLELLQGATSRVLHYHQKVEKITEIIEFEEIKENIEALVWVAKRLLQTIESNLSSKCLAAERLKLALGLDGGGVLVRELRLAEPQVRAEALLAVVLPYFESLALPAGVVRLEVEAVATFGSAVQREWFGRRELPQPERWAETVGRLEALLGADRVGIPVPADSFRPDGFALRPALNRGAAGGTARGVAAGDGFLPEAAVPLRRYRPPWAVAVAGEPWGAWQRPLAVLAGAHAGRITAWRGPFPGSGQWWDPAASWQRVEWDVAIDTREILRLAWLPPAEWRIEGVYG